MWFLLKASTLFYFITIVEDMEVMQFDIKTTFLHGAINKDNDMIQVPRFEDQIFLQHVYHLKKSMYDRWKHSMGGALWALSWHVCNVYFCKMCCIYFWDSLLVFKLDSLIFTKLMFNIILFEKKDYIQGITGIFMVHVV